MDPKDIEMLKTLCFLASMQHGHGLMSKSPDYIRAKKKTAECALSAWMMLDSESQNLVLEWSKRWNFSLDSHLIEVVKEANVL